MEKILSVTLKLNFTPNTLGCYGLMTFIVLFFFEVSKKPVTCKHHVEGAFLARMNCFDTIVLSWESGSSGAVLSVPKGSSYYKAVYFPAKAMPPRKRLGGVIFLLDFAGDHHWIREHRVLNKKLKSWSVAVVRLFRSWHTRLGPGGYHCTHTQDSQNSFVSPNENLFIFCLLALPSFTLLSGFVCWALLVSFVAIMSKSGISISLITRQLANKAIGINWLFSTRKLFWFSGLGSYWFC